MVQVGIEAMNVFGGSAYVDVEALAERRGLDKARFHNLLMKQKAVALTDEDPVTFAVNAANPIIQALSPEERDRIELLITCSESGIDFGKSISTYVHHYLALNKNCRLFELKQACYSGTAGFQMANNFILSQTSPGAKALVIATDISRFMVVQGEATSGGTQPDWSYAEPSAGAGAVAILISESPHVFQLDVGANGYYGYEVMDTCRPIPDSEAGNADLSLLSYLDCCEQAFGEYRKRVRNADYRTSFHYLSFHTPFGGMVKGAHRAMLRKVAQLEAFQVNQDFEERVMPGMQYCQRVGNIMGGTVFLSLASTIDCGRFQSPRRVGCFSYGSGCCSEFYSGVVTDESQERQRRFAIRQGLDGRHQLSLSEYESVLACSGLVKFGTRNVKLENHPASFARTLANGRQLYLSEIKEFHRRYQWSA
jgi:polyketide biosynthesis 3-hydroxy-3-methylglutaryl-CoA synthase-like enzyme PksG